MNRKTLLCYCSLVWTVIACIPAVGQEKRARPPKFSGKEYSGVFYEDVTKVVDANRPNVRELGNARPAVIATAFAPSGGSSEMMAETTGGNGKWRAMADPVDLEDEVKRQKLGFDGLITTPGRFKSGDYRDARRQMFVLSTLMAVISEYDGDVRFKEDAGIARDLLSRSAINLTGDSFADAKQRKADLQDLVSGGGLNRSAPVGANDWSTVATRTALMEYLEDLQENTLKSGANDASAFAENKTDLKRAAAMVAIVGQVLMEEGMDEADDADYRELSQSMKAAALELRAAISRDDAEAARLAVGAIGQSCSACHEQYR